MVTCCCHSLYGRGWKVFLPLTNYYLIYSKGLEKEKKMNNPCDFLFVSFKLIICCNHWSVFWGMRACTSLYFFPALLPRNHNQWFIYSLIITTEPLFFNQNQCITWAKLFTTSLFIAHNSFFIQSGIGSKVCLGFMLERCTLDLVLKLSSSLSVPCCNTQITKVLLNNSWNKIKNETFFQ